MSEPLKIGDLCVINAKVKEGIKKVYITIQDTFIYEPTQEELEDNFANELWYKVSYVSGQKPKYFSDKYPKHTIETMLSKGELELVHRP